MPLLPASWASGVRRSPMLSRPSLGRVARARWPLVLGAVCGFRACLSLAPSPVPRFVVCCARFPGLRHQVAVFAWHLSLCRGCRRQRASLACLVAPLGAPHLVRFGRSRCSSRLSRCRGAFPQPWSCRARLYWADKRGHCACRWPLTRQGRWACSASYPFGACDRVVPCGSLQLRSWAACAAVVWRVWTRSLTRPVSCTVCISTGDSASAPGLFRVDANTS